MHGNTYGILSRVLHSIWQQNRYFKTQLNYKSRPKLPQNLTASVSTWTVGSAIHLDKEVGLRPLSRWCRKAYNAGSKDNLDAPSQVQAM